MSDNLYQAPSSGEISNLAPGTVAPTTFKQKLFSFEGRFTRTSYWAYGYGMATVISLLAMIPLVIMIFHLAMTEEAGEQPSIPLVIILAIIALIFYVPACWVSLAGIVKRFHDRGKSGHMAWILLIPYVGGIWILVECGCLPGTPGPNAYGPDPLQL